MFFQGLLGGGSPGSIGVVLEVLPEVGHSFSRTVGGVADVGLFLGEDTHNLVPAPEKGVQRYFQRLLGKRGWYTSCPPRTHVSCETTNQRNRCV